MQVFVHLLSINFLSVTFVLLFFQLLRVEPANNSMALVYVTEGTSHFVKYVNSKVKENTLPFFHDIFCFYTVEDSDVENDTDDADSNTDDKNKD